MTRPTHSDRPWNASFQFHRVPLPREVCGLRTVLRPYLSVILFHGDADFPTLALLDSGADFCMLPREVAEVLGVDVDRLPGPDFPFGGVASGGTGRRIDLRVVIRAGPSALEREIPFVVVVDGQAGQSKDILLGRHPFFRDFDIGFRMGYTDDPEIGKFTVREVRKRRNSGRYRNYPPIPTPSEPADR